MSTTYVPPYPDHEYGTMLTCSCCGSGLRNTPEENTVFNETPYPYDDGFGMCVRCGGDRTVPFAMDEESIKKRLGWAACMFYEARFSVLRNALNPANQAKWDTLSYGKKVVLVIKALEEGMLKW